MDKKVVFQPETDQVVQGEQRVWLDRTDLTLGKIESLQFLEFEEGIAGNLSYWVPPQVEHHQVAAVGQSLLGDVVWEVPAEVHLGKLRLI